MMYACIRNGGGGGRDGLMVYCVQCRESTLTGGHYHLFRAHHHGTLDFKAPFLFCSHARMNEGESSLSGC